MIVDAGLTRFHALPDAVAPLVACCAAPGWAVRVAGGRPYRDRPALYAAADAALAALDEDGMAAAVAAHPRIGRAPTGAGVEAAWSRREQRGVTGADAAELAAGNAAYEQRFGQVFLICATGLSAAEIGGALRRRLTNDDAAERAEVRVELAKIVRIRLDTVLAELAAAEPAGTRGAGEVAP